MYAVIPFGGRFEYWIERKTSKIIPGGKLIGEVIFVLKKVIAVEEGLSQVRNALERGGYAVVKPGSPGRTDATVITGMDENVMGRQDILDKSVVINASGKTVEQILDDLKQRL